MFEVVANGVEDIHERTRLYEIIRAMIAHRNRERPDSMNMDIMYAHRHELVDKGLCEEDILDVFKLSGHHHHRSEAFGESRPRPQDTLQIDATGFSTIVINMGNGKKVVLHV